MSPDAPSGSLSSEMNENLRQILRWVKFQSLERARQLIEKEVAHDPRRILVYELTDGERGRPEVAKISGVPSSTIQQWWDRWYKLGILEPSPKRKGMVRKLCGIEEVGLDLPREVKAQLEGKTAGEGSLPGSTMVEPSDRTE